MSFRTYTSEMTAALVEQNDCIGIPAWYIRRRIDMVFRAADVGIGIPRGGIRFRICTRWHSFLVAAVARVSMILGDFQFFAMRGRPRVHLRETTMYKN
jgi:hypothetical protein